MNNAYLSIGTNIGDRKKNLKDAVDLINSIENVNIEKISKIYETKPWGYTQQDNFLNICVKITTNLAPFELLEKCQYVEKELKRVRLIRWGPRTIDIDILLYDDIICEDENLILPHPRMHERAFVLIPLMDLEKEIFVKGKTLSHWLSLVDVEEVKEYMGNE